MKAYYLHKLEPNTVSDLFRMKGVPHKIQRQMDDTHFKQDETQLDFFSSYGIRPTKGGEMSLIFETRKTNCCINYKRSTNEVRDIS